MRFLDATQVRHLAEVIGPRYGAMVLLAGGTGLRFGEAAGLTVDRLQWLKRSLIVSQTLVEVKGRVELRQTTKTATSRRAISLPGFLVDVLAAHVAEYPSEDGFVFTSPAGGPLRRTNWRRRAWLPAVRASIGEPMRFHDLRHSHAAQLIAAGEHPKVIQARLGHTSIRTTLDAYGHLFDGLDEQAADRIDAMYRNATVSDPCQIRSGEVVALPLQ
jgi:integrase